MNKPTTTQAAAFQGLYDAFNKTFFGGVLAECFLNFSRKSRALGFFAPERWAEGEDAIHEISINPSYLASRSPQETASTLLHEMVHLWQQEHGEPGRGAYHNREWGSQMEAVGLMPSSTGKVGGKRTGDRVSHYVIKDGAFDQFWAGYQGDESLFPLQCQETRETTKRKTASNRSKTKYVCECGTNIWGKPGIEVSCGECGEWFEEA